MAAQEEVVWYGVLFSQKEDIGEGEEIWGGGIIYTTDQEEAALYYFHLTKKSAAPMKHVLYVSHADPDAPSGFGKNYKILKEWKDGSAVEAAESARRWASN